MSVGRRSSCANQNSAGVTVGSIEWISPGRRKTCRWGIVHGVVQILGPVSRGFDDDDALVDGVSNGIEIIRPPFNCDVALLPDARRSRPRAMNLEENDIARPEPVCGLPDNRGCRQ